MNGSALPKAGQLSPTEVALAQRLQTLNSSRGAFPIRDPELAEVMELLHRMTGAHALATFQWMAGDAIVKLRAYVVKQQGERQP